MNISVFDGSSYFKGLLILISKDKKITKEEHEIVIHIGKTLGFEKKFTENSIHEILDNKFISIIPPVFSTRELAEKFLKDGLRLAFSDGELHPKEEVWLFSTAEVNNIEKEWLFIEKNIILQADKNVKHLEVDSLTVVF